ncbi:ABC transporter ATP-binding protein [Aquibaculum arenosum]|uniref:Spermidine/putrescine import ATP-binding protein PotA n=1 Tax=Aquibaculum arenosum TaxID=3032591 RepID=A0ABT5YPW9_9PROT|nr:ABC transporter ATP-binding protein [Fodinicurvata sp. CAU 1616]MDF2096775.1 ABC transporter ATP-binding protein [Fodinicurvata sp. CAU 1616]
MSQATGGGSSTSWQQPDTPPFLRIEGVVKRFGDFVAVDGVSLDIYRKELFCLLGGSGCGKTTLLRMLAGFEQPSEGHIYLDGSDMTDAPPYERPVNMMFQSYALFPHMTVAGNVAFGLKQDRVPAPEIKRRVTEALDLVQLGPFAKRKPHQLSGGQRQRVALARCLIKRPKLLLLDEPLAALDKKLREQTQFELMTIQEEVGITFIVVTHDQEEAMSLSTRIAVMDRGQIAQVGTPTEIYEYPRTRFTADFIGSINFFDGKVTGREGEALTVDVPVLGISLQVRSEIELPPGREVCVAVRPEKISISREPLDLPNVLRGKVRDLGYLGNLSVYRVELDGGRLVKVSTANTLHSTEREVDWDDMVYLGWRSSAALVLSE